MSHVNFPSWTCQEVMTKREPALSLLYSFRCLGGGTGTGTACAEGKYALCRLQHLATSTMPGETLVMTVFDLRMVRILCSTRLLQDFCAGEGSLQGSWNASRRSRRAAFSCLLNFSSPMSFFQRLGMVRDVASTLHVADGIPRWDALGHAGMLGMLRHCPLCEVFSGTRCLVYHGTLAPLPSPPSTADRHSDTPGPSETCRGFRAMLRRFRSGLRWPLSLGPRALVRWEWGRLFCEIVCVGYTAYSAGIQYTDVDNIQLLGNAIQVCCDVKSMMNYTCAHCRRLVRSLLRDPATSCSPCA